MVEHSTVVRIVIADDHEIFRDGLKVLLAGHPEFEVAGEASDGEEAILAVAKQRPDILLLDLAMPKVSGMEVLHALPAPPDQPRVVLLTGEVEGDEVAKAFELGVRGLVLKDTATTVLLDCIRHVMAGKYWVGLQGAEDAETALRSHRGSLRKGRPESYGITAREMEIVKAVVSGSTNRQIAAQLAISEQTVKHHVTNIYDKLGVYNRLELTLFVYHHGLIDG